MLYYMLHEFQWIVNIYPKFNQSESISGYYGYVDIINMFFPGTPRFFMCLCSFGDAKKCHEKKKQQLPTVRCETFLLAEVPNFCCLGMN